MIRSEQHSYTKVFHPGNFHRYRELPTNGPGGGMSMFVVLGECGRHTDGVLLFVVFFLATLIYKVFRSDIRIKRYWFYKFNQFWIIYKSITIFFYYLLNIIYINFNTDQWVPLVRDLLIKLHFIKLIITGWPTCHLLIN